jgi:hypothetical protein
MKRNKLTRQYLTNQIYATLDYKNSVYAIKGMFVGHPKDSLDGDLDLITNNLEVKIGLMLDQYRDNFGDLPVDLKKISQVNNENEATIRRGILKKLNLADTLSAIENLDLESKD